MAAGPAVVYDVTNNTTKNTINNYFAPAPRQDAAAQTEPSKKKQKAEPKPPPKPAEKLQFGDFLEACVAAVGGACFAYHTRVAAGGQASCASGRRRETFDTGEEE